MLIQNRDDTKIVLTHALHEMVFNPMLRIEVNASMIHAAELVPPPFFFERGCLCGLQLTLYGLHLVTPLPDGLCRYGGVSLNGLDRHALC